jgi:hypothetical protein
MADLLNRSVHYISDKVGKLYSGISDTIAQQLSPLEEFVLSQEQKLVPCYLNNSETYVPSNNSDLAIFMRRHRYTPDELERRERMEELQDKSKPFPDSYYKVKIIETLCYVVIATIVACLSVYAGSLAYRALSNMTESYKARAENGIKNLDDCNKDIIQPDNVTK